MLGMDKLLLFLGFRCSFGRSMRTIKAATLLTAVAMLMTASVKVSAQERQLFDGGMMLHSGYLNGRVEPLDYQAKGMTFGIGGVLRFHLGDHLRAGFEGYVSNLDQMDNGSYVRMGWGGLVADGCWRLGRWMPYAGLCVGGGRASTLLMFAGDDKDWLAEPNAVLHNEMFMLINPYVGVEFFLTDAVHLTLKADRLTPLTGEAIPTGVRFYLGFIFAH